MCVSVCVCVCVCERERESVRACVRVCAHMCLRGLFCLFVFCLKKMFNILLGSDWKTRILQPAVVSLTLKAFEAVKTPGYSHELVPII